MASSGFFLCFLGFSLFLGFWFFSPVLSCLFSPSCFLFFFLLDLPPLGLAYCWPFYKARTNGCSPVRLFFPGRRISLGVLVFCWDFDARLDPYLPGIVIFMKIGIDLCVLVGLGCRHFNFFPFFASGFAASEEEEEEEQCMFETASFWSLKCPFSIWALKF